jgi:ribosomal protein S20
VEKWRAHAFLPQVLVAVAAAKAGGGSTEALNTLLSEAYQVIDKAAGKGILKKNTAAPAAAPSAA